MVKMENKKMKKKHIQKLYALHFFIAFIGWIPHTKAMKSDQFILKKLMCNPQFLEQYLQHNHVSRFRISQFKQPQNNGPVPFCDYCGSRFSTPCQARSHKQTCDMKKRCRKCDVPFINAKIANGHKK